MDQVELVDADVLGSEQLGRLTEVTNEERNTLHIDFLSLARVVAQL